MIGEGLSGGALALEGLHSLRPRRRLLGRQFVVGCCRFPLFELKFQLFQQPCFVLGTAAVQLAPLLLDLELEVTDQGFSAREARSRIGDLGLGARRFSLGTGCNCLRFQPRGSLRKDHRMRGGQIGGERFRGDHIGMESHPSPSAS